MISAKAKQTHNNQYWKASIYGKFIDIQSGTVQTFFSATEINPITHTMITKRTNQEGV
jgi:hypothetical protein